MCEVSRYFLKLNSYIRWTKINRDILKSLAFLGSFLCYVVFLEPKFLCFGIFRVFFTFSDGHPYPLYPIVSPDIKHLDTYLLRLFRYKLALALKLEHRLLLWYQKDSFLFPVTYFYVKNHFCTEKLSFSLRDFSPKR